MVSHYEPAISTAIPMVGRADTVTVTHYDAAAWLKTVTRLGLNKFSLMHYGLQGQSLQCFRCCPNL